VVAALMLVVMHFGKQTVAQFAEKTQKAQLAESMRRDLAAASEAEKSAVLAITDQDSQVFADEARRANAKVESSRKQLGGLLEHGGTAHERELLEQFGKKFGELETIDAEVLKLAVQNTNLKASALASGPALAAIQQMSRALDKLIADNAHSPAPKA